MTHPSIINAETAQSVFIYEELVTESIKIEENKIIAGIYLNNAISLSNIVNNLGIQGIDLSNDKLPVLLEITVLSEPMLTILYENLTSKSGKSIICNSKIKTRQGPRGIQLVLAVDFPNFLIVDSTTNGFDISGFEEQKTFDPGYSQSSSSYQESVSNNQPVNDFDETAGFKSPKSSYEKKPVENGFNVNLNDF